MSTIDLDLVELRCKLRGLTCQRMRDEVTFQWGSGQVLICRDGEHMLPFYGSQYSEAEVDAGLALVVQLTRPRLTLAEIVASPPEGWVASRLIGRPLDWFWSPPGGGAGCVVRIDGPIADGQPTFYVDDFEGRLAAHRAVVELLVLLGEVES